MKRWRLGICDREAGYARSLARFLRARGEGRLEVRVFTAKEAAAACLDEGGLDCLLADEECAAQWVSYPGVFVAALSEKDGDGEVPFVGKYQSAERIWKRLLEIGAAGDWEQPSSVGSRKTEIIGICSPSQDLKGLVLGLLAGRLLSGTERSLFLTIGEFSALPELLGGGGEESFPSSTTAAAREGFRAVSSGRPPAGGGRSTGSPLRKGRRTFTGMGGPMRLTFSGVLCRSAATAFWCWSLAEAWEGRRSF